MIINREELIKSDNPTIKTIRKDLIDSLDELLDLIRSDKVVEDALSKIELPEKRIKLICLGKAAIPSAEGALKSISLEDGMVASNRDCPELPIKCIKGSHPIPDENSLRAGKKLYEMVRTSNDDELLLFVISGGASAIVELPLVSLKALQQTTSILLKSDMDIESINCIRKHLSAIKGGKLLKNLRSSVISLIISDVIGDDLSSIASGLTYYDETTTEDALLIIEKYNLKDKLPKEVIDLLISKSEKVETLKKEEFPKEKVKNIVISNNTKAVSIMKENLEKRGYRILETDKRLTCNVTEGVNFFMRYLEKPSRFALIVGGEVTVDVKGQGIGGRNQEFALQMAGKLKSRDAVFLSFATDGKDGNSPAAGAIVDNETLKRAESIGLKAEHFLKNNDSYNFFKQLKDCILSSDTKTNLTDIYTLIKF